MQSRKPTRGSPRSEHVFDDRSESPEVEQSRQSAVRQRLITSGQEAAAGWEILGRGFVVRHPQPLSIGDEFDGAILIGAIDVVLA